jgi:hypothetical protein
MMRVIFLTFFTLSTFGVFAQTTYKKFQWQPKPPLHTIDSKYADEAAVYVTDSKMIEYAIEKEGFFTYKTVHRIVHINNDKGIEYFNKVYLPFDEGLQMTDVKARTILPDGKVIELDEKNIKDLKEENRVYKIFALDGLTKGCEVEYYYTLKKYPSFFGREIISSGLPVMKGHFELIAPKHLKFEAKNYNNLPACKDSVTEEKRYLWLDAEGLDAAVEEKYSNYDASLRRVEYKLCYNEAKEANQRLFTWNQLAKQAFEMYTKVSEKEMKKIKDLVAVAGVRVTSSEQEKIVALENYFKKNFITREDIPDEDAADLLKVIKDKVASHQALCKLFCAALSTANVPFQIVLTGDRNNYVLDRSLENWSNARNFLFYFPSTKKFMAPTEILYRYPWIPPSWAGTNGLFCVTTTLGSFQTAMGEIKTIPMEDYQHSYLNMNIAAKLNTDVDALEMEVKQLYGGYAMANYKAPFVFAPVEEQHNILKELIKFGTNSENIISHSFENKELEQIDNYQPFVISAKVKSSQMVERAGNKIIIKVGEFIGEQAEMYDTKERTTNIDLEFPHALVRTIELTIPDGYEVKNLKDLHFNEVYKESDKPTMGFVCTYEQKGNVLKIMVREDYANYFYPIQQYTPFKKVINAAADFNKVVLVLDKK